jgi:predicted polyphosphate/ATP-dependent NAD kinase
MGAVVGFLVNPIAGMGGRVGLKGTDASILAALERGAVAEAPVRAARALEALGADIVILTAGGAMGAGVCRGLGLPHRVLLQPPDPSGAADTRAAVAAMVVEGVDLILFAGGDGTARDIADVAGKTPVLGIPSGVKMVSAIFALTPTAAGAAALAFLTAPPSRRRTRTAEVLDIDLADGRPVPRLYATLETPALPLLQRAKAVAIPADDAELDALCHEVARETDPARLTILGPGTTTQRVARHLGLDGTLLGVDAILGGQVVVQDASEAELLALLQNAWGAIVVGIVGGQGALFGRGNQQIAPSVIRAVGRDGITVLAGAEKLATLDGLFVDTGDPALDAQLAGYWRVRTGPGRTTIMRVRG